VVCIPVACDLSAAALALKVFGLTGKAHAPILYEERYNCWVTQPVPERGAKPAPESTFVEDAAFLSKINVFVPGKESQPVGFMRFWPEDFIVEEIAQDGAVATIDLPESATEHSDTVSGVQNATIVKCNTASSVMTTELARLLGVRETQIGHAGLKDERAITAQRISVSGVSAKQLAEASSPYFFTKDISPGQQLLPGKLQGNRFCLTVRFDHDLSADEEAALAAAVSRVRNQGFPNYYMSQRFAPPRLGQEHWGAMLLRGEEDAALRAFLTEPQQGGNSEIGAIRAAAAAKYGDWTGMAETFAAYPRLFLLETTVLEALAKGARTREALRVIGWQAGMWINVLNSWLFNEVLCRAEQSGETLPEAIPLPLAPDGSGWDLYGESMKKLGLDERAIEAAGRLPYYRPPKEKVDTRKFPKIHKASLTPKKLLISFSLEKGAYATALIAQLAQIATGKAPEGTPDDRVDARAALGFPSVGPITDRFDSVTDRQS
jgi:TruD family tRNA pseudouridine synthase